MMPETSSSTNARPCPKSSSTSPGGDFVDRVWKDSDRPTRVLRSSDSMLRSTRVGRSLSFQTLSTKSPPGEVELLFGHGLAFVLEEVSGIIAQHLFYLF